MAEHKRETIEAMGLRPGDAALDVSCGTGDEARLIAERVGPSGRAVGVDLNAGYWRLRARTPHDLEVAFVAAHAHALPFAIGEFSAARVERALQHMVDPGGVVAQMARVVRPGGRVVALSPRPLIAGQAQPASRRVSTARSPRCSPKPPAPPGVQRLRSRRSRLTTYRSPDTRPNNRPQPTRGGAPRRQQQSSVGGGPDLTLASLPHRAQRTL